MGGHGPAGAPPASPQSPCKRPKKVSSKALAVAAVEAREAAAAPAPASPPPVRTSTYLPSSSLRPEYAETPTRKQITQMIAGNESTSSSSSDSDTDDDFSPDGAPGRRASPPASSDSDSSDSDTGEDVSPAGSEVARVSQPTPAPAESDTDDEARPPARAPPRGPPVSAAEIAAAARSSEDDARPPANDDTDDDLPSPPPVVKQEPVPSEELSCAPRTVHKKYVGVSIDTRRETTSWSAKIGVDGETEYLGNYYSPVEAAEAYDKRARELKRPVNFPREGEEQAVPKTRRSSTGPPPAKRARTTDSPAPAAAPPQPTAPQAPAAQPNLQLDPTRLRSATLSRQTDGALGLIVSERDGGVFVDGFRNAAVEVAARGAVRPGDRIVAADGTYVAAGGRRHLKELLARTRDPVSLLLYRGDMPAAAAAAPPAPPRPRPPEPRAAAPPRPPAAKKPAAKPAARRPPASSSSESEGEAPPRPARRRGRCAGDAGLRRRRRPRRATRRLRPPHDRDRERQRRDPRARAIRTTTSWNSFRTPGRACARGDGNATPRAQKPRRSDANATRRSGSATRPGSSWPRETTCSRRSSRSSSTNMNS